MLPIAAREWALMCAFDKDDRIDGTSTSTVIRGVGKISNDLSVFFKETNILRAREQLVNIIKTSTRSFPCENLLPHVVEQIQTFSLRTCSLSTMQQQNIGLDLFCFWTNTNNEPKFTLRNFTRWLATLECFFACFFYSDIDRFDTRPFICKKLDNLSDKLCHCEEFNELYIFNMAAAVVNTISKMAKWAETNIHLNNPSLDPMKNAFQKLESDFDQAATGNTNTIVAFIGLPFSFMNFYRHDYGTISEFVTKKDTTPSTEHHGAEQTIKTESSDNDEPFPKYPRTDI